MMDKPAIHFERLEHTFGINGQVFPVPVPITLPGEGLSDVGTTAAIDAAEILVEVYRAAFPDDEDFLRHGLESLQTDLKDLKSGKGQEKALFDSQSATGSLVVGRHVVNIVRLSQQRETPVSTVFLESMIDAWLDMLPPAQQALGELGVEQAVHMPDQH